MPPLLFDIRDDGAVPGTDATAAIRRTITRAAASGQGAIVRIPPGVWPVSETIDLPPNVTLSGAHPR